MKKNFLEEKEKKLLEKQHKTERDRRIADRIKVVLAKNDGWSNVAIAAIVRINENTVKQHLDDYFNSKKLKPENGGSQAKLNQKQLIELKQHLSEVTYSRTKDICEYVKNEYGVSYTIPGMTSQIRRLGFVYKKSKHIPTKADKKSQELFVLEYNEIKKNKAPDEAVFFMDGVHPQMQSRPAYGWILRGHEKQLKSTPEKKRLNILGAVDADTKETVFYEAKKTINSDEIIAFLIKIIQVFSDKKLITIVCDNARYFKSLDVKKFLANNPKIKLKFLPPYSPNLNLIERLWKLMHEKVSYNQFYESLTSFRVAIFDFFQKLQSGKQHAKTLEKRLVEKFNIISLDNEVQVARV